MGVHLGESHANGKTSTKSTKSAAKDSSLAGRIFLVAMIIITLAFIGLIAEMSAGDSKSPFSSFMRSANTTFTTVGQKIGAASAYDGALSPQSAKENDIAFGPDIYDRQKEAERFKDGPYSKDGWKDGRFGDKKSDDGKYGPKDMAKSSDKGRDYDFKDRAPKKDDYFAPKKEMPKEKSPPKDADADKQFPTKFELAQEPPDTNRKIIRTGEMDFEVDSYDVAIVNITRLIIQIKGAFISDSKSGQLKNGKLQGYVVVRLPPQFLDQFVLDLRRDLGKIGELKTQRINSQDVTKQYTDTESGLKAARAMEERFLSIIKTGKGEIKDLIAAENALGEWRTKIEKMEGEIRYYNNQVGLSTLTISLSERELQTPFALVATEKVNLRIEAEDVKKAHATAEKAVLDAKGRVLRSEVKQHAAGQLEAVLHADLPPAARDNFTALVEKLGIVSHQDSHRQQEARGGSGRPSESIKPKESDVHFEVTFNNLANVAPRNSTTLQIAVSEVADSYHKLHDAINKAKGLIRNTNLNESDKKNITASIDFTVPTAEKPAVDRAIADAGALLTRNNVQTPITELASERKFGYHVTIINNANIPPREKTQLKIEVKDVDKESATFKKLAQAAGGRLIDSRTQRKPNGEVAAVLIFDVPFAKRDSLVHDFKDAGKLIGQEEERIPGAPENELAVARIHVIVAGENPIVPNDEGLSGSVRFSLYLSFKILVVSLMLIMVGLIIVLPWGLVIWGVYKLYGWLTNAPPSTPAPQPVAVATSQPVIEAELVKPKSDRPQ